MINEPTSSTKKNNGRFKSPELENYLNKSMYGNPTCQRCSLPALRPSNGGKSRFFAIESCQGGACAKGSTSNTVSRACRRAAVGNAVFLLYKTRSVSYVVVAQEIELASKNTIHRLYGLYGIQNLFFLLAGSACYLGLMSICTYASTWLEIFASACG